jgi:hypothetical protein
MGRLIYASPIPGIYHPANFWFEVYGLWAVCSGRRGAAAVDAGRISGQPAALLGQSPAMHVDTEAAVAYCWQYIAEWNACDADDHGPAIEADREQGDDFWDDTDPNQFVENEY